MLGLCTSSNCFTLGKEVISVLGVTGHLWNNFTASPVFRCLGYWLLPESAPEHLFERLPSSLQALLIIICNRLRDMQGRYQHLLLVNRQDTKSSFVS
jgi:hypothetical protein